MPFDNFSHVTSWVFDLDNTLYPPEARLFDQIEVRMTDWVARVAGVDRTVADRLRKHYWESYGTTLAGLMAEHDADPEPYLIDVHEISMDHLEKDADLATRITDLPGRRIVYTNGSAPYAQRVLDARELGNVFDAVYGVEHADFRPKPQRAAFEIILQRDGIQASSAAMFEDDARNLLAPFQMGMQTVHVTPITEHHEFIHHSTQDLTGFLSQIAQDAFAHPSPAPGVG
ncbi:MAG: pyrimidine 5'-nucleotidase [Boseongicola sp.]|nr:MAG: pyrimidine 5'-nucleotidase [Boseongicola sp.]